MDVVTGLEHFALINYSLPAARLRPHIPDRFEIQTFDIGGEELALMSAVPFVDAGFRFTLLPFLRLTFCQTNYRVYVIDKTTGEQVIWFFGTTLGSFTVHLARMFFRLPWYPARYKLDHDWDEEAGRYRRFDYQTKSKWGPSRITLRDTGEPIALVPGFDSFDSMMLTLTHPMDGYFSRLGGSMGTYSVSHELLPLTTAVAEDLYFGLFETLELLSAEEMMQPHSVFLCPKTEFRIYLPPRRVR